MNRRQVKPDAFSDGPFTLTDARNLGLDYWHLRSANWRRLGPSTYASSELAYGPMLKLQAASCRLPPAGAFSGLSAAWLHGLDVEPCNPIEVTIPKGEGVSGRSGMKVSRARLVAQDVVCVEGMRTTAILRTLEDLSRRMSLVEATVVADMALHSGGVELSAFMTWARTRCGGRGLINLRRVAEHADPKAESPMETRLRMLLVLSGLPRPAAQVPIHDRKGRFLGRPDLYYAERQLGLEYDGGIHRESLVEDNRRQNRLLEQGIRLLRFTASDVLSHPALVVAQVRAVLEGPRSGSGSRLSSASTRREGSEGRHSQLHK
jgi:very-short-patch-repair endonuclease